MRTRLLLLSEVGTANEMQKIEPCDPAEKNKQEETESGKVSPIRYINFGKSYFLLVRLP